MKIIRIDASVLKQSACLLKLWRIAVQGYRSKEVFNDTEFGSAIHVFEKELHEGRPFEMARAATLSFFIEKMQSPNFKVRKNAEYLTPAFLHTCCEVYYNKRSKDFTPLVVDGEVLVEKNFEIPYYETEHVSIRLTGTIDIIGRLTGNGMYCIGDYKTTRTWNHVDFLAAFKYNIQLPFYLLAIQLIGNKYPQGIFGELVKNRIGCFIEGIFLSEKEAVTVKRSDIWTFSEERIQVIKHHLDSLCWMLNVCIGNKATPNKQGLVNDTCAGKFIGGTAYPCEFLGSCLAPNEDATNTILNNSFRCTDYNPLDFRK